MAKPDANEGMCPPLPQGRTDGYIQEVQNPLGSGQEIPGNKITIDHSHEPSETMLGFRHHLPVLKLTSGMLGNQNPSSYWKAPCPRSLPQWLMKGIT